MKISRTRFVIIFLISTFAFQFISNSLLGTEVRLFPRNGVWYPGTGSSIGWKNTLATILYPVKYALVEPLSFLGQDPDGAPPVMLVAFTFYWTIIAVAFHFLITKILIRKRS